jgi:cell division protein FtsQ
VAPRRRERARAPRRTRRGPRATTRAARRGASAPAPAPRRAAPDAPRRRHPVVRALVIGLLSAATVVALGEWALRAPIFRVHHVSVLGLHHESEAAVLAATGLVDHPPLVDVSAASLEARLGAFPWIGSVRVVKRWPDSVTLRVSERVAVAVAFSGTRLRYVDESGHDLGPAPTGANLATLVARGATGWPYLTWARDAAYVAARLPAAFAAQVRQVVCDRRGNVSLVMTTPVTFVLGPPTQLHAKFVDVASVIAHGVLARGDVVDVTAPGALAVSGPLPG